MGKLVKYHPLREMPDQTKLDTIVEWMKSDPEDENFKDLDKDLRKMYDRYEIAAEQMRQWDNQHETENYLMKKFNYSRSSARRDCVNARYIFGTTAKETSDEFDLHMLIESCRDTIKMAKDGGSIKEQNEAHKMFYTVKQFEKRKATGSDFDPAKLEASLYFVVITLQGRKSPIAILDLHQVDSLSDAETEILMTEIQQKMIPPSADDILNA